MRSLHKPSFTETALSGHPAAGKSKGKPMHTGMPVDSPAAVTSPSGIVPGARPFAQSLGEFVRQWASSFKNQDSPATPKIVDLSDQDDVKKPGQKETLNELNTGPQPSAIPSTELALGPTHWTAAGTAPTVSDFSAEPQVTTVSTLPAPRRSSLTVSGASASTAAPETSAKVLTPAPAATPAIAGTATAPATPAQLAVPGIPPTAAAPAIPAQLAVPGIPPTAAAPAIPAQLADPLALAIPLTAAASPDLATKVTRDAPLTPKASGNHGHLDSHWHINQDTPSAPPIATQIRTQILQSATKNSAQEGREGPAPAFLASPSTLASPDAAHQTPGSSRPTSVGRFDVMALPAAVVTVPADVSPAKQATVGVSFSGQTFSPRTPDLNQPPLAAQSGAIVAQPVPTELSVEPPRNLLSSKAPAQAPAPTFSTLRPQTLSERMPSPHLQAPRGPALGGKDAKPDSWPVRVAADAVLNENLPQSKDLRPSILTSAPPSAAQIAPWAPTAPQTHVSPWSEASAGLPLPIHHPRMGELLAQKCVLTPWDQVPTVEIQVNPESLGPIQMTVSLTDGQARLAMSAAHETTRQLLETQLPLLQEQLKSQGIALQDISIRPLPEKDMQSTTADRDATASQSGGQPAYDGFDQGRRAPSQADPGHGGSLNPHAPSGEALMQRAMPSGALQTRVDPTRPLDMYV